MMPIELKVSSNKHVELIDITSSINSLTREYNLKEGILNLFVPHTTAGITVNESCDPDVGTDLENALKTMVPNITFKHGEGNSSAHLLSSLIGCHAIIPVTNGKLDLGTWQGIFFCEFDGPRSRKLKIYWQEAK
ncbi:secondary thiamine-phosphate synthase enzyme YjbQ [Natranaerofaba carboxydovora]|uniref:secondary thiamine-phosphate synthase enzyme YjbQ n=1 Tax=Natranaerofaba carboxydovora TaxID=2742683 RepID=UPI001F137115|nr:secondary thiamine-phosphate synthase enzyme YjbQ [Natranaerofaba carboxydovora]UMZ73123.1 hypothetical protein ACONDI_00676 [Natranaerofaba carboxydovora]